jgi:ubiquinone/menaquinone biosynthesis C-methylase UbiE
MDYWKKYYSNKEEVDKNKDLQNNISRTRGGVKVNDEVWSKTLSYIVNILTIREYSTVLELCCGNGVIIGEIAKICKKAYGVDYSGPLLNQLSKNFKQKNLVIEKRDVLKYELKKNEYDAIIIYFSIQHFDEKDTYLLIDKSIEALKVNGKLLIGDIPDLDKKWKYINKPIYHRDYFKRVEENRPKIGYWFQKDFFKAMSSCFPNATFKILEQPDYQINSDYRFDVLIEKNEVI